jgi:hypothetical protein
MNATSDCQLVLQEQAPPPTQSLDMMLIATHSNGIASTAIASDAADSFSLPADIATPAAYNFDANAAAASAATAPSKSNEFAAEAETAQSAAAEADAVAALIAQGATPADAHAQVQKLKHREHMRRLREKQPAALKDALKAEATLSARRRREGLSEEKKAEVRQKDAERARLKRQHTTDEQVC